MTYCSLIRNFKKINLKQAETICARLSLSMSADTLLFCKTHYKKQLKRDPFLDELKMLDMLASSRKQTGASLAVTEFFTNDEFVAKTYADILEKRKQLYPEAVHPITFEQATNMIYECLKSVKRKKSSTHIRPYVEDTREGTFYPNTTCAAIPNAPYRLRLLNLSKSAASVGDTFVLICPAENDNRSAFRRKSAMLLQNDELMQCVKDFTTVGLGGVLEKLLNMTNGAHIYLPALSLNNKFVPVTVLCNQFRECHILRIAQGKWKNVSPLFTNIGVRALPFATVLQKPKFVFARNKESTFEIDTHFLRSLKSYEQISVKLTDESTVAPLPTLVGTLLTNKFTVLTDENTTKIGEVTEIGTSFCVGSTATPISSHYKSAIWTILAPASALSLCGVPCSQQEFTVTLAIPKNLSGNAAIGKCMSTILGLYRAQTEFELTVTTPTSIQSDKDVATPSIFVWATAQNALKKADTFANPNSFVYAVTPEVDANGLPDFSAFKETLDSIASLAYNGNILSARVLSDETILDGITKMSSPTYTCEITDNTVLLEGKSPLCILFESYELLPWRCIGEVKLLDD